MTEPVLVLAWLLFAHLIADFVLQNDWIAINKGTGGRLGWNALLVHAFHVALCLVPVVFAYGARGVVFLALVAVSHVFVDRWKVQATRSAEAAAQAAARRRVATTGSIPESGLGAAWTPWPGILFLADQVLHVTFTVVGWLVILEGAPLFEPFVQFADAVFRSWDRTAVHGAILTTVVVLSLMIVNTRGAFYFILALVSPRDVTPPAPGDGAAGRAATVAAPAPRSYTVRVGPLVATIEPETSESSRATGPATATATASAPTAAFVHGDGSASGARAPAAAPPFAPAVPSGAPARIGATIGALERLLVVAFILTGAEAAIGFVIAAKTIARFKQLDDRGFAEYYLLGTLASIGVAIGSGLLAQAALRTLG